MQVRVKRSGSSVLVLAAYNETSWTVQVEPGATVERIVVSGYHVQTVTAPAGIPVEILSHEQTGSYLGAFGYEWPAYTTTQLVDAVEAHVGRELTSFRGCSEAASFEVDEPGAVRPPHTVSDRQEPMLPAACAEFASESAYCLTLNGGMPTVLGLDSGRICSSGVPAQLSNLSSVSSWAWQGDYTYACIRERGLARVSLVDGSVDIAPIACQAVSTHREGLLLLLDYDGKNTSLLGALAQFDSFEAAARREASCLLDTRLHASHMAVRGDQGYFARHVAGEILTARLGQAEAPQELPLQGYDDWIQGMHATDDGRLIILGPDRATNTTRLFLFELSSGEALGLHPMEAIGSGLMCRSPGGGTCR
ncbi:hypothetical protein JQX13_52465 [Archangium violaceum]|uniref:hypothetical protein n=1 Tax=Archangium violaceum TaxID=83451 RepID=UPI00193BC516|nr:hypothetical protein [Archangium violaceum]QRK08437.1 hypothetical protein JQX13_52465 [Archangium violaceum]